MRTHNFHHAVSAIAVALCLTVAAAAQTTTTETAQTNNPPNPVRSTLFDSDDVALLLIDHQTGLLQTVKDIPIQELRTNTATLAKLAVLAKIPVIYTASVPDGPNGPLISEINEFAPNATYVARKGEISSWDNPDFVKAVEDTGKRTLIMAGIWTSVCVAFPAVQAKADGYNVYAVWDASGDMSEMASHAAMDRMTQAGVIPVTTNAVVAEVQRTWNRPDAAQYGALYGEFAPHYKAVTESYQKAQEAARKTE